MKLQQIEKKMASLLASDKTLKESAQRAFQAYLKSVFLMRDKSIFQVAREEGVGAGGKQFYNKVYLVHVCFQSHLEPCQYLLSPTPFLKNLINFPHFGIDILPFTYNFTFFHVFLCFFVNPIFPPEAPLRLG